MSEVTLHGNKLTGSFDSLLLPYQPPDGRLHLSRAQILFFNTPREVTGYLQGSAAELTVDHRLFGAWVQTNLAELQMTPREICVADHPADQDHKEVRTASATEAEAVMIPPGRPSSGNHSG